MEPSEETRALETPGEPDTPSESEIPGAEAAVSEPSSPLLAASASSVSTSMPADGSSVGSARHLVAVLFAGGGPVKLEDAARALGATPSSLEGTLLHLRENPPLGLRVQRHNDELELVSDPDSAPYVEALLGLDRPTKLSRAALETMSIVAYRQPVTRGEIDAVRGVNSDSAVTTLLNRGLIAEVGRKESVGRPTLYGSTSEFLQHLGLNSLEDLPSLPG